MRSSEELYLDYLDANCGSTPEFYKVSEGGVIPPVYSVVYRDTPEKGTLTAFTLGLSSVDFAEWTVARPELVISVESDDVAWGLAVGHVAARARGKYGFCVGETVNFNAQISRESHMSAFVIFYPSIMSREQATLDLPDRKIAFLQLYPLYAGELHLIRTKGEQAFWQHKIDTYNVRRPDISKPA